MKKQTSTYGGHYYLLFRTVSSWKGENYVAKPISFEKVKPGMQVFEYSGDDVSVMGDSEKDKGGQINMCDGLGFVVRACTWGELNPRLKSPKKDLKVVVLDDGKIYSYYPDKYSAGKSSLKTVTCVSWKGSPVWEYGEGEAPSSSEEEHWSLIEEKLGKKLSKEEIENFLKLKNLYETVQNYGYFESNNIELGK